MFSGVGHQLITGGEFTTVQGDLHVHNAGTYEGKGIQLLRERVATGALHNSADRYDPPKCHEGTRNAILEEIMGWIQDDVLHKRDPDRLTKDEELRKKESDRDEDKRQFFLWLYGPAGAGKSAIAQTIADICAKLGLLAGSFFFSRTAASRNDHRFLVPTLAYQLTLSIPQIREGVSSAIENDRLIFGRSLEAQLETLIMEPLSKLELGDDKAKRCPGFIVIDGLDECGQPESQSYILKSLSSAVSLSSHKPIFFLIASRPEQEIRDVVNRKPMFPMTRPIFLDNQYKPDEDIRIFLASKFRQIKDYHPLNYVLPPSWPSSYDMDRLIQQSSGQFIYASTAIKFVSSTRHRPPHRLDVVLGLRAKGRDTPFVELDALYNYILSTVSDLNPVMDIFRSLLLFKRDGLKKPHIVENFFGYEPGDLQILLADLHSLIFVPPPQNKFDELRLFHASLGDFLMDKSRSGQFFISKRESHTKLAEYCMQHITAVMNQHDSLRRIEDLEPHQQFSCQYFLEQCTMAYPTQDLLQQLEDLNLTAFFNLLTSQNWIHPRYTNVVSFFNWLEEQCAPIYPDKRLYRNSLAQFDRYLHEQLENYPKIPFFYHLITLLTLKNLRFDFGHLQRIGIAFLFDRLELEHQRRLEEVDNARLCLNMEKEPDSTGYRDMMAAFFSDRARSGLYCIRRSHYVDLAMLCANYLTSSPPWGWDYGLDTYALKIILNILPLIPGEKKFAKHLGDHRMRLSRDKNGKGEEEISEYIKAEINPA